MTFPASLDQPWKKAAAALEQQLSGWLDRTGPAVLVSGGWPVLPEHRSQVERLDKTIRRLLEKVKAREAADALQTSLQRRDGVYATALVWEFFRSRLSQRDSPGLRSPLLFADDLAFDCWAPAMVAANRTLREPPLGAFSARENPALWPRERPFLTTSLPPPWDRFFQDAINALPVPVFDLPWGQVRYLPAYTTIAHEVGHAVNSDLDVAFASSASGAEERRPSATLDASLSGMAGPWTAWRSETVADLWGLLGCGAGYAAVLAGVLADPVARLDAEVKQMRPQPRAGSHPPALLRMAVLFALADAVGVDVAEVKKAWNALTTGHDAIPFVDEVGTVAAALTSPWPAFGGRRPTEVLPPPPCEDVLEYAVNVVINGTQIPKDPRTLAAGAAWACFTKTDAYAVTNDTHVLDRYVEHRSSGVRGPGAGLEGTRPDPSAVDAAAVDAVLEHLESMLTELETP